MIVNLMNSDHGWCETIIQVSGAWEAAAQKDHGFVLMAWNQGTLQHGGFSVMAEVQERVRRLL